MTRAAGTAKAFPVLRLGDKALNWAGLLVTSMIWGTSFILIKKSLGTFNGLQIGGMRVLLTSLFFLPFFVRRWREVRRRHVVPLLVVGLFGTAVPSVLFPIAQVHIASALAGMLNSLVPFFTLIVGAAFFHTRVRPGSLAGVLVGLLGAAGLMLRDPGELLSGINAYAWLPVLSTLMYSVSVNTVRNRLQDLGALTIAAASILMMAPVGLALLLSQDPGPALASPDLGLHFLFVALLAMFSSSVAVVIFNKLISRTSALFASSSTYIIPIFAILWGISDGETIAMGQWISILLILAGVYLVNRR